MNITHNISKIYHSAQFREVVRFGIVGCVATLIQYAIYYLFNQCIGWGATTSLTIGYAVSFVFNFFLSNYFTFRTKPIQEGHRIWYEPRYQLLVTDCFSQCVYVDRHSRRICPHTYVCNSHSYQLPIGKVCP